MRDGRISLFGNFGTHNLGNECTLEAAIHNVREHLPGARIECIWSAPENVSARYHIPAVSIYGRHRHRSAQRSRDGGPAANWLIRALRRLFIGLPQELAHWVTVFRTLKGTKI